MLLFNRDEFSLLYETQADWNQYLCDVETMFTIATEWKDSNVGDDM